MEELKAKIKELEEKRTEAYRTHVKPIDAEKATAEQMLLGLYRKNYPVLWFIVGEASPTVAPYCAFQSTNGGPFATEEEAEAALPPGRSQSLSHHIIRFSVVPKSTRHFERETFERVGKANFYYFFEDD